MGCRSLGNGVLNLETDAMQLSAAHTCCRAHTPAAAASTLTQNTARSKVRLAVGGRPTLPLNGDSKRSLCPCGLEMKLMLAKPIVELSSWYPPSATLYMT